MRIVLVVKPYEIDVYTEAEGLHTYICGEPINRIENETTTDYERRMIFVLKEMCTEMREHDFFKKQARSLSSIDVVLGAPWCTYEAMHIEKKFERPTKITRELIQSLHVTKEVPGIVAIESNTSQVLLNGYLVREVNEQMATTVDLQYLAVYANSSFLDGLRKTAENIFHTHKVQIVSVYGYVQASATETAVPTTNELRIILEEESIDITYLTREQRIVNFFVPYSYIDIEAGLEKVLETDDKTVAEVLLSRTATLHNLDIPASKNAKHLWPDLEPSIQKKIEDTLVQSIEIILQHIRNCIDSIDIEYLKESTSICVYGLNKKIISAYGYELATRVLEDGYLSSRIQLSTNTVFVKKIF